MASLFRPHDHSNHITRMRTRYCDAVRQEQRRKDVVPLWLWAVSIFALGFICVVLIQTSANCIERMFC